MSIAFENLILSGRWGVNRELPKKLSNMEMKRNGYDLFHEGSSSDFYMITRPDNLWDVVIIRNNKIRDKDLNVDLHVQGKAELYSSIARFGTNFAELNGIKTTATKLPSFLSKNLLNRSEAIKMGYALEVDIPKQGYRRVKFMFFNHVTRYFYERAYGYNKATFMHSSEIDSLDTATFVPVSGSDMFETFDSNIIKEEYSDIVSELKDLFVEFSKFALSRGIVIFHSCFEVFLYSENKWALSHDAFAPTNTRYVSKDGFNNSCYGPMEYSFLLNHYKELRDRDVFSYFSGNSICRKIPTKYNYDALAGYREIYDLLSWNLRHSILSVFFLFDIIKLINNIPTS